MATIVISYRRNDSKQIAGRIFDRLENHYGKRRVFMDIDAIPVGLDFRDHIRTILDECDVLLAIIGPAWLGGGGKGEPTRIEHEGDYVRIEVETALKRGIPVVPLLIDGTPMPKPDELPQGPFRARVPQCRAARHRRQLPQRHEPRDRLA